VEKWAFRIVLGLGAIVAVLTALAVTVGPVVWIVHAFLTRT